MKNILLFFALCGMACYCSAQSSKLNPDLLRKIHRSPGSTEEIHVLVQGDPSKVKAEVEKLGGLFKYSAGDISSIRIAVNKTNTLLRSGFVRRMEYNPRPMQALMDTMVYVCNLDSVYSGLAPLAQGYDGRGVIVGIIDEGIDWLHPDFRDSSGTRILYLWDQTQSLSPSPSPYNYGVEWTKADINAGVGTYAAIPAGNIFHGTRVPDVAVGNGDTCGIHRGVARKADIIYVVGDIGGTHSTFAEDATNYIFTKAQALGKPCVINASFGDSYGSHDGTDLRAQIIDNMITAKHGRAFVCAAGNAGNQTLHVGYNLGADSSFTWTKKTGANPIYFGIWSDSANFTNVHFAIGADVTAPNFLFRGNTPYLTIGNFTPGVEDSLYLKSPNGIDTIAKILRYPDFYAGVYGMEFLIYPDSTTYNFRLMTKGSGRVDAWGPNWVSNTGLPTSAVFPDMATYVQTDSTQNIESSFQCSNKVITVANFQNRYKYLAFDGNVYSDSVLHNEGNIAKSSSRGPTRTGLVKPDIAAPGDWVFSTTTMTGLATLAATPGANNQGALAPCKMHRLVKTSAMTSGASPVVAGVAALYMQMDTSANWQEIKDHITMCATKDNFTTASIPNNRWGWGKVNAFEALTGCGLFPNGTATQTIPLNGEGLEIFPNCFTEEATIRYKMDRTKGELTIYDISGRKYESIPVNTPEGTFSLSGKEMSAGIYFCQLSSSGKIISTKKLIVVK